MIKGDINAVLKGKTPTVQGIWMKTLRLITFAIDQCKKDPEDAIKTDSTIGIKTDKPPKSDGHPTGATSRSTSTASITRLAAWRGLQLNWRSTSPLRLIGRQHLKNGCLSWQPSKTSKRDCAGSVPP